MYYNIKAKELVATSITGSNMTTRKLRKYISNAVKLVNENMSKGYYANVKGYDVLSSMEYLKDNIGVRNNKLVGKTSYLHKDELLQRASLLKSHLKIALEYDEPYKVPDKARKRYEELKKRYNPDNDEDYFTEKDFLEIVDIFNNFGEEVLEKYLDSDQLAYIYNETAYSSHAESYSLYDIMEQIYEEMRADDSNKGLSKEAFTRKFSDLVTERINKNR